jgi:hypothetical protein
LLTVCLFCLETQRVGHPPSRQDNQGTRGQKGIFLKNFAWSPHINQTKSWG